MTPMKRTLHRFLIVMVISVLGLPMMIILQNWNLEHATTYSILTGFLMGWILDPLLDEKGEDEYVEITN